MMPTKQQCQTCGGKCCYLKQSVEGFTIWTNMHCKFLDTETRLCKVYEDRFEKCPNCHTLEGAKNMHFLPETCPYVIEDENYKGPKRL